MQASEKKIKKKNNLNPFYNISLHSWASMVLTEKQQYSQMQMKELRGEI